MNTSKSLYELVCEFLHPDKPDNVTAKEMLDLMEPGLVPAIVEAVEGLAKNIKQVVPPRNVSAGLDPDGYDQGRKDALDDFLEAIKEWQ